MGTTCLYYIIMYLGGGIVARADGAAKRKFPCRVNYIVSYGNETQNGTEYCLLKHVNINEIRIRSKMLVCL